MTDKRRTSARPSKSSPGHGKRPAKASGGPKAAGASGAPAKGSAPGAPAKGGLGPRKTDNFNKFYNKKRNSAIKEAFRQEKKAAKRERKAAIEQHFEQRRIARGQQPVPPTKGPIRPVIAKNAGALHPFSVRQVAMPLPFSAPNTKPPLIMCGTTATHFA